MEEEATPLKTPLEFQAGQIMSLYLHNFMCHELFKIKLKPGINFIHGNNGSGKSAILTSICTVLGSHSRFMNRGTQAELIKDGSSKFEIIIQIKNTQTDRLEGLDCDSFFIKREVNRSGTGHTKIANAPELSDIDPNEEISLKSLRYRKLVKQDLMLILQSFNIQTANPCVILNQDTAREFLNTKTAKERYTLFTKATLFSNIEAQINESKTNLVNMNVEVEKINQEIEFSEKSCVNAEKEYLKNKQYIERETLLENLNVKMKILELQDNFNILASTIFAKVECELYLRQIKAHINKLKAQNESSLVNKEKFKGLMTSIEKENIQLDHDLNHQMSQQKKFVLASKGFEKGIISSADAVKKITLDSKEVDKRIQKLAADIAPDLNKLIEQTKLDIKKTKSEKAQINRKLKTNMDQIKAVNREISDFNMEASRINRRLDDKKEELFDAANLRKNKSKILKNKILRYGEEALLINNFIDNNTWKKKPIGPIGLYVQLCDPEWYQPVTNCIGNNTLYSYLVSCYEDFNKLNSFIEKAQQGKDQGRSRVSIFITGFSSELYNYKKSTYGYTIKRVIDLIRVSNIDKSKPELKGYDNWILNFLTDQFNVESSYLVNTSDEGYNFYLKHREQTRLPINRGKKFVTLYCKDGSKMYDKNNRSIAKFAFSVVKNVFDLNKDDFEISSIELNYNRISGEEFKLQNSLKLVMDKCNTKELEKSKMVKTYEVHREIFDGAVEKINTLTNELQKLMLPLQSNTGLKTLNNRKIQLKRELKKTLAEYFSQNLKKMQTDYKTNFIKNKRSQKEQQIEENNICAIKIKKQYKEAASKINTAEIENLEAKYNQKDYLYKATVPKITALSEQLRGYISSLYEILAKKQEMNRQHAEIEMDEISDQEDKETNIPNIEGNQKIPCINLVKEMLKVTRSGKLFEDLILKKTKVNEAVQSILEKNLKEIRKCVVEPVTIWSQIDKTRAEIICLKEINHQNIDQAKIMESKQHYLLLSRNLKRFKSKRDNLMEYKSKLDNILAERKEAKEKMKYKISFNVNKLFVQFLNKQGHDGKIEFNHKTKELAINVFLYGKTGKGNKSSNIGTFSGGERSFSTLAFILAIGEFLETPFRAIDEFDIFMDSVNRNVSTNMLIEACKRNLENQYILITPQDLSLLKKEDGITIHKLTKIV